MTELRHDRGHRHREGQVEHELELSRLSSTVHAVIGIRSEIRTRAEAGSGSVRHVYS